MFYINKLSDHKNEKVEFEIELSGILKDELGRQANAALRIYSRKNSEILNSKSEKAFLVPFTTAIAALKNTDSNQ